jgi:hypothetical protein
MDELRQVEVRGLGGKTAVARLVEERDGTRYVVSEREYQAARHEGRQVEARLGFPKDDVSEA